jgi:hypothetical protein
MGRRNGQTPKRPAGAALELLRKSRDWSYQELTDNIAMVTGHRRNQDCIRKICQGITRDPQDRTSDILNRFLAACERVAS